jgi:Amt family ammonium transporter
MMTLAIACFYGGLVENKHFFNQLFLAVVCMGIVPIQWCLFGYSFAFGPGNSVFGSFNYAALRFIGLDNLYGEDVDKLVGSTIPSLAFVAFQCAFAIITPALIGGAVVGRMKLIPYMIFIFLWSTCSYNQLARWIFSSQGWLRKMGTVDFAGGLVVHLSSGISGLVAAIILGFRLQFDPDVINIGQTKLPFTILGTGLLWVGWMEFNGGSALAANGNRVSIDYRTIHFHAYLDDSVVDDPVLINFFFSRYCCFGSCQFECICCFEYDYLDCSRHYCR